MFSDTRLSSILWGVGLVLLGILLLLFNFDLLAASEPFVRLTLIALLAAAGAGFILGYFASRHDWARLIPGWTLLTLAAMVMTSSIDALDQRISAALLFIGLALAFGNIFALDRETHWWAVIPGGFLLVLGTVIGLSSVVDRVETLGAILFVGLGLVFVLLYWLGGRKRTWWALVPGAVLTLLGLAVLSTDTDGQSTVARWWPVLLIVLGLLIALTGARRRPPARMTVNTAPKSKRFGKPDGNASASGLSGGRSDVQERGQLGDYSQPAPGATIDILSDPEEE